MTLLASSPRSLTSLKKMKVLGKSQYEVLSKSGESPVVCITVGLPILGWRWACRQRLHIRGHKPQNCPRRLTRRFRASSMLRQSLRSRQIAVLPSGHAPAAMAAHMTSLTSPEII